MYVSVSVLCVLHCHVISCHYYAIEKCQIRLPYRNSEIQFPRKVIEIVIYANSEITLEYIIGSAVQCIIEMYI